MKMVLAGRHKRRGPPCAGVSRDFVFEKSSALGRSILDLNRFVKQGLDQMVILIERCVESCMRP
nr:hypothetical protein Iba_chr14cCG6740 [Ipomoea batatas]